MQIESSYNYIFFFLFVLFCHTTVTAQPSNIADQRFIENADQFSEESGVRIYSGSSSRDTFNQSSYFLAPTTELQERQLEERLNKKKARAKARKKVGFSFSDMAKISQKTQRKKVVSKNKKSKGRKFTFSNMATYAQKTPTFNKVFKRKGSKLKLR